jgi:hypothetical protein
MELVLNAQSIPIVLFLLPINVLLVSVWLAPLTLAALRPIRPVPLVLARNTKSIEIIMFIHNNQKWNLKFYNKRNIKEK